MSAASNSGSDTGSISDEEVFEVERIIGKQICYGEVKYHIKWQNYSDHHNTWEPVDNLSCQKLIDRYEERHADSIDSTEWDPKPKKIWSSQMIDGKMEYQVEFDDKIRSMISVTYGPMKDLIAKYERDQAKKGQSKKGKQNEDEKENSKPKRGRPKKDDSTEEQPTRKVPKRKANADENGNQGEPAHRSKTATAWYSNEVDRISDMRRSKEGVEYLVEYKDSNDLEWVPMNFVKRNHPQKVINFYENCIVWD